jgi:hypothetical protein
MSNEKAQASEEQLAYANFLGTATWLSLGLLVILFFVYVSGILPNVIEFEKIPHYWTMRASEYIHEANAPIGWGWASLLDHGDMLPYIGIVLLAGLTILSYLRVLPIFLKKKETPFVIIILIELGVLIMAASGVLTSGGH